MEILLLSLLALSLIAAGVAVAVLKMEFGWHSADNQANSRIIVEQKKTIRRLTRERNKWEAAAARVMQIRLNPPQRSGESPQKISSKFVSPSEAIYRAQQAEAAQQQTEREAPAITSTNGVPVPPAVRAKFLEDAKPER